MVDNSLVLRWFITFVIVLIICKLLYLNGCGYLRRVDLSEDITKGTAEVLIPRQKMWNVKDEFMMHNVTKRKIIYVHGRRDIAEGSGIFRKLHCAVKTCSITTNINEGKSADLVIIGFYVHVPGKPPFPRKPGDQIWAIFTLEAPGHAPNFQNYNGLINWTITYRSDSTVQFPYFKLKYFDSEQELHDIPPNIAEGKKKKVAWLVSNLSAKFRIRYFQELAKYIQADRMGRSAMACPQKDLHACLETLGREYKFYFAAENLFCMEYMTEKVCRNAYKYKMIPIVLGARKEDYVKRLPPNSFIMAEDFKSPKELADYLHKIDKNDTLYNQFFQYRKYMYVEEQYSPPWCEVCRRLHMGEETPFWYDDINQWWSKDACRSPPWQLLRH